MAEEEPHYRPIVPARMQIVFALAFAFWPIAGLAGGLLVTGFLFSSGFGMGYAVADAFGSGGCAPSAAANSLFAMLCALQVGGWFLLFRFRKLGTNEPKPLFVLFGVGLAIGMLPTFMTITTLPAIFHCLVLHTY